MENEQNELDVIR